MTTARQVYAMLGNENLWEVAAACRLIFEEAEIPYAVCGGVAVCLHGYRRNTVDLDLVIRRVDSEHVKQLLTEAGLEWDPAQAEFRSASGVAVQFLLSGDRAGRGAEVYFPEPIGEFHVETIEGFSVLKLSKLIEMKIACGLGTPRRMHKDLADVVELIAVRNLNSSFARFLHKSIRGTFRELVRNARGQS